MSYFINNPYSDGYTYAYTVGNQVRTAACIYNGSGKMLFPLTTPLTENLNPFILCNLI